MVKVRAALKMLGIDVRTEWGSGGWALAAADKAKLRRLMAGEGEIQFLVQRQMMSA